MKRKIRNSIALKKIIENQYKEYFGAVKLSTIAFYTSNALRGYRQGVIVIASFILLFSSTLYAQALSETNSGSGVRNKAEQFSNNEINTSVVDEEIYSNMPLWPDFQNGKAWSITLENDIFTGDDDGVTNVIGFQIAHGAFDRFTPHNLPDWLYWLVGNSYINRKDNHKRGVVYVFGQVIQTPKDILSSEPILNDLPYAGLLISSATLYSAGQTVTDKLSLWGGVIGPLSFAEETQTFIHSLIGSDIPNGWDNQLSNEPVLMVEAGKVLRVFATPEQHKLEFDTLLSGDISFGNFRSSINVTAIVRVGNNLTISYPFSSILPDRQVNPLAFSDLSSWYLFAGFQSAYVANNILLNGNTFTDSQSLPLDHTLFRSSVGIGTNYGKWAFSFLYSEIIFTDHPDPFGSISITRRF